MSAHSPTSEPHWTIRRLLRWTVGYLGERGVEDARLASEVLLAHAAECRRIDLYARFDTLLNGPHVDRFRTLVRRAATGEPIAYLVGEKEFFSLRFRVTRDVLIPRPETETLVEVALDHCRRADLNAPRLLDLGTGSGCIAVALLSQLEGATAVGTDVSRAALAVAVENAERHGVSARFTAVEADGTAVPSGMVPPGGFDLLISNPPYVPGADHGSLSSSVREYEPAEALTDRADGLSFYRDIAAHAGSLLAAGGVIVVEVGDSRAPAVVETMADTSALIHRETRKDRVVGCDRVIMFSLRPTAP